MSQIIQVYSIFDERVQNCTEIVKNWATMGDAILVYIALLTGMFVQHEVALDALCGATCVTTQGFPCIINGELDLADMGIVFVELSGDGCMTRLIRL